ncbi:transposase [Acinetobacter sp. MB5]|uniref:transposase n=1 Tax=Acinetobacter sp. MB5 TaxID=2069438 RepID=UPI0013A70A36|nr:transposase [Acinetobacter sp. MB5]
MFNLPKKLPEGESIDWNVVIVDAAEIPIQRPKLQKKSDRGKKVDTFKAQAVIQYKTQQILSLCSRHGAVQDFELFKRNLNQIPVDAFILEDKSSKEFIQSIRITYYLKNIRLFS